MTKLRIGVIGAGSIATAHLDAYAAHPDVDLIAIADINLDRARAVADRYGAARAYDDAHELLAADDIDGVSICTWNDTHALWAIAAIEAGKHVLVEKPLSRTVAEAVEIEKAAASSDRVVQVGFVRRHSPNCQVLKSFIDAGELGEMYYAETASLRRRGVPQWGMFHMKEHNAGGPIYDLGVHALDALLWIMGNPKVVAVSGQTYTKLANQDEGLKTSLADSGAPLGVFDVRPYDYREFDVEDMAAGFLRLETGATVSIKTSWAANIPEGMGGTFILGTRGGLRMRPLTLIRNLGSYQVDVIPKVPQDPNIAFYGHWKETAHMLNVIRGEEEMMIKREEVLNVIRALDGLYQSALEGREVCLD